jgi:hypothetical protein
MSICALARPAMRRRLGRSLPKASNRHTRSNPPSLFGSGRIRPFTICATHCFHCEYDMCGPAVRRLLFLCRLGSCPSARRHQLASLVFRSNVLVPAKLGRGHHATNRRIVRGLDSIGPASVPFRNVDLHNIIFRCANSWHKKDLSE